MSSVKIFSAEAWDLGVLPTEQHQIKIASGGLMPNDRLAAEKFADPQFLHWLSGMQTHPDCFYVTKVAMGGSHRYGPNRWGDGFREEVLSRDCKTFESAKAYRQHKSDGPYYGQVKLARFRDRDGFVELVTEYYGTDKVARERGGKLADMELDSLHRNGHIAVSMGSFVPGDVCVICNHFAPKPADRCMSKKEGGLCPLFGCANGMLKMAADGRMNYVDNPVNRFYDISMVRVGADPVAYGLMLPIGDFSKTAGMHSKLAEFASSIVDPSQVDLSTRERTALDLAYYWAEIEKQAASPDEFDGGYATHRADVYNLRHIHSDNEQLRRDVMSRMVKGRQLPDFVTYAKSAGLCDTQIEEAKSYLPNLYTRMIRHQVLVPAIKQASISKISAENNRPTFASVSVAGVDLTSVTQRALMLNANSVELRPRKLATFDATLPAIVVGYGAMKLAFFAASDHVDPAILRGVVRRDFFDLENIR